jgi:RNA 2',3'-cyclic 3'-phosphodiesterase
MRLFVAIPLPGAAHEAVASRLRELKAGEWPVRWVADEGLHLTLKFFGEVVSARLETIAEMLGFCVDGMKPLDLAVTGAGVFPHRNKPRVIRLDLEGPPELELLQDRIERGGERIGFPPEGRPFHPHITLGRVREGHRLPAGALETLDALEPQPPFRAERLTLFESELTRQGPRYHVRADFPLA